MKLKYKQYLKINNSFASTIIDTKVSLNWPIFFLVQFGLLSCWCLFLWEILKYLKRYYPRFCLIQEKIDYTKIIITPIIFFDKYYLVINISSILVNISNRNAIIFFSFVIIKCFPDFQSRPLNFLTSSTILPPRSWNYFTLASCQFTPS